MKVSPIDFLLVSYKKQ